MPFTIDRRGFLKASFSALALTGVLRAGINGAHVALLSDTHISKNSKDSFRGFNPHANLRNVAAMVTKTTPDLVLINGDLARAKGRPADYAAWNSLMNPLTDTIPMVVTMGNHDHRENSRKALAKLGGDQQPVVQKLVTVIDAGPCVFVLLDSLLFTGKRQGLLGEAQRDWLSSYLAQPASKPVVVFVHHNPAPLSMGDAGPLLSSLTAAKNVKALVFGHTHVYSVSKIDGLHLVNLPAVGYNFADGNPVGWVDSLFTTSGVTLTLHAIGGEVKDDGKVTKLDWRA